MAENEKCLGRSLKLFGFSIKKDILQIICNHPRNVAKWGNKMPFSLPFMNTELMGERLEFSTFLGLSDLCEWKGLNYLNICKSSQRSAQKKGDIIEV